MTLKILQKWLPKSYNINKFIIKNNNNDIRGVYCKKDIKKGELIIKINLKYLITIEKCKKNKIIIEYFDKLYKNISNNSLIALFLLLESKNKKSIWTPYLKSLPKKNNHVLNMSNKQIQEFKGTTLLNKYHESNYYDYKKKILTDYNLINKYIKCSLKKFKYYRSLVGSRIFSLNNYNEFNLNGLVPFCDLLNHNSNNYNTKWIFNTSNKYFELKSTTFIPKNTELLDSYGDNKSNTLLMLYYGFTIPNNYNNNYIPILYKKSIIKLSPTTILHINDTVLQKKCSKLVKTLKCKTSNINVNNIKESNLYILQKLLKSIYN
tara:strand:+ start:82 stop:1041 length:960 start_codon:yes stop_codon:yes gene_type:complete